MSEQITIEYLTFWASYYYDLFSPLFNILIAFSFNTMAIRKVYDMIKIKYESIIEIKENIPTE